MPANGRCRRQNASVRCMLRVSDNGLESRQRCGTPPGTNCIPDRERRRTRPCRTTVDTPLPAARHGRKIPSQLHCDAIQLTAGRRQTLRGRGHRPCRRSAIVYAATMTSSTASVWLIDLIPPTRTPYIPLSYHATACSVQTGQHMGRSEILLVFVYDRISYWPLYIL